MSVLRLAYHYLRIGALNELQYRINFWLQLMQSAVALTVGLVGLSLVFYHTTDVAGWSRAELLAVMGVHILMGGLIGALIQPNMLRLMEDVKQGTLDFVLIKPVDAQALISVREIRLWRLVDVLVGMVVLGVALVQLGETLQLLALFAFGLALACGAVMIYSFWLILTSVAFWVIRVDDMINLFEGIYAAGRWPVGIYPAWLQGLLTFVVPVAFAVTVPAEALTARLDSSTLALACVLALLLFLLARLVWRTGLRRYGGASA
ncbi:ABC transporter permease [Candidatus Viridilinea mediisalina]|uniref:ABC transporter permease n=1 Tax=Candidatus Viridilinea mediisalina TaxID=2024553 RepID=A0A2A6RG49_9CHLR|nr:ABC-2 family transporter protein [Candidatus Viridilinea mediisalina]PDW01858.1 ABC transporter permease [Candidatus Viridilinea mediisalina]